ncbi:MAG: hypothetical protein Q8Q51_11580 [Lutibacter sp.]|nr:hypothetical protein [Lutibacter sp.]
MKKILSLLFIAGLFISCSNEETTLTLEDNEIIPNPTGLTLSPKEYALKLDWDYVNNVSIDSVLIYRAKSNDNFSFYKSLVNNSQSSFTDNFVGIRELYKYKIAYKENSKITGFSNVVSSTPIEPLNNNIPVNGEIGGIHYAYWDFEKPTFHKIKHRFTIHDEPTNKDGELNQDGLYYQFYQGIMNDTIGFYYGIQTKVTKPNHSPQKGLIFSRWKTRDVDNYAISEGGWGETAGYEGDFIGIRKNYEWRVGEYEITIEKDSTSAGGDWYSLKIKDIATSTTGYIGSLRFEKSSKSSGIKSGGITWSELYSKKNQDTPLPNWHVSVDDVLADDIYKPYRVYTTYSNSKFLEFSNIYTTNNKDVHFLMGPNVKRKNPVGYLWSN